MLLMLASLLQGAPRNPNHVSQQTVYPSKAASEERRPLPLALVESPRVGREKACIKPNAAQGGVILREARHTCVPVRARRQEAAHLQRLLGGYHRRTLCKDLVGSLAR